MNITETTPKQAIEGCIRKLHEITVTLESVYPKAVRRDNYLPTADETIAWDVINATPEMFVNLSSLLMEQVRKESAAEK